MNQSLQDFTFYGYSDVKISFIIKTKIFDLKTLKDFLNLNPTRGWTDKETYIGKQINKDTKEVEVIERQRPCTLFVYETKGVVNSNRFQDHAEHLLAKLDLVKGNLRDLIEQPSKFEIMIHVYLQFDKNQNYFGFSSQAGILKRLLDYCHLIEWRNE